jgi:hypothetical protein
MSIHTGIRPIIAVATSVLAMTVVVAACGVLGADTAPAAWVPMPTATWAPNIGQLGGQPCDGSVAYDELEGGEFVPPGATPAIVSDYTPGCYSLRLIDAASGLPLPGLAPIDARHSTLGSTSPDGHFLAVLHWSSQSGNSAQIRVLDLRDWSQAFVVGPAGIWRNLVWEPDGGGFYVIRQLMEPLSVPQDDRMPAISVPAGLELWRVDLALQTASLLMPLPFDSFTQVTVSASGDRLYFLAQDAEIETTYWSWQPVGDQFLSVIDTRAASEAGRAIVPGLRSSGGAELGYASFTAGVALAESSGRYFIAHANSDVISVIDLGTMAVRQTEVSARAKEPLPKRFLAGVGSLFVRGAEAKGADSHTRQAVVSADGRFLAVTGTDWIEGTQDIGSRRQPAGLRIIDTTTMRAVTRDTEVSQIILGQDGGTLYAIGSRGEYLPDEERMSFKGNGLQVFDFESGGKKAQVSEGIPFTNATLSRDGRYLLLLDDDESLVIRDGICSVKCRAVTVFVFDTVAGTIVSEHVLGKTTLSFVGP